MNMYRNRIFASWRAAHVNGPVEIPVVHSPQVLKLHRPTHVGRSPTCSVSAGSTTNQTIHVCSTTTIHLSFHSTVPGTPSAFAGTCRTRGPWRGLRSGC